MEVLVPRNTVAEDDVAMRAIEAASEATVSFISITMISAVGRETDQLASYLMRVAQILESC